MPSYTLFGYRFFFYSNEFKDAYNLEPVHIHVCKGRPSHGAPKWWVGENKICRADNADVTDYGLKNSDIKFIEELILSNTDVIIKMWKEQFGENMLSYHSSVQDNEKA
ncbi:MAG: DUF4160 domain-containing protein [Lachnospiraceae bacterium]|nr:DUF4160 domain-containing protein [Lachnospiraceae bacterium]